MERGLFYTELIIRLQKTKEIRKFAHRTWKRFGGLKVWGISVKMPISESVGFAIDLLQSCAPEINWQTNGLSFTEITKGESHCLSQFIQDSTRGPPYLPCLRNNEQTMVTQMVDFTPTEMKTNDLCNLWPHNAVHSGKCHPRNGSETVPKNRSRVESQKSISSFPSRCG